jgi:hypothetical protein
MFHVFKHLISGLPHWWELLKGYYAQKMILLEIKSSIIEFFFMRQFLYCCYFVPFAWAILFSDWSLAWLNVPSVILFWLYCVFEIIFVSAIRARAVGNDVKTCLPNDLFSKLQVQSADFIESNENVHYGRKYKSYIFKHSYSENVRKDYISFSLESKERNNKAISYVQSLDMFENLSRFKGMLETHVEGEFIVKMLEDLAILAYNLSRAKTKLDFTVAMTGFVKARLTKSLTSLATEKMIQLRLMTLFSEPEIQSYDESPFAPLRRILDDYESVREVPIFKKMYKFSMYALSMSLFDSIGITYDSVGFSEVEAAYLKQKFHKGPDFVHCVLDTTLFICEKGYQCYKLKALHPLIHSANQYEQWVEGARKLQLDSKCLHNCEAHGFTYFDFYSRLEDTIEKGNAIVLHIRNSFKTQRFEQTFIQRYLDDLKFIRANEMTRKAAREGRKAPFSVLLFGGSSVGKSSFEDILFQHYAKTMNLPGADEYKYVRCPAEEFWSGFSSSQWCIVLDDIAYRKAGWSQGDKTLDEMLQIVNNVQYCPPQADLADKGKTPLRCELVIASTNTVDLNAWSYFSNPLAIQRRLPYVVDISPKPEFARSNVFLDSGKVTPPDDGTYPNYWNITLKRVVPYDESVTHQRAKFELVEKFEDIHDFLAYFSKLSIEHDDVQKQMRSTMEALADITLCSTCHRPTVLCNCDRPHIQSNSIIERVYYEQLRGAMSNTFAIAAYFWLMFCVVITHTVLVLLSSWKFHFLGRLIYQSAFFQAIVLYVARKCGYSTHLRIARLLGKAVSVNLVLPEKLFHIASAISAVVGIYSFYRMFVPKVSKQVGETQGNVISSDAPTNVGVRLAPEKDTKENVWMQNDYIISHEDVGAMSVGWNGMERTQMISRLRQSCYTFISRRINDDGATLRRDGRAVCIKGQIYMLNNHSLPEDGDIDLQIISSPHKDGVTPNVRLTLQQSQIARFPEKDLAFVKILALPPGKDIMELFCSPDLQGRFKGAYVAIDERGLPRTYQLDIVDNSVIHVASDANRKFDRDFKMWNARADANTVLGDCGSIMLAHTKFGPSIIGIHFLGGTNKLVSAIAINKNDVEKGLLMFGDQHVVNGPPTLSAPGAERTLVDLHKKATVRYIQSGSAKVYGTFAGMRARHKSRVQPTFICEQMLKHGYKITTGPPVMSGWEPWNKALQPMVNTNTDVDMDILNHCVESFVNDILSGLPKGQLEKLVILDNDTALNGAPGVGFIDKINRNTSMGNPWKKAKKGFLTAMEPNDIWQDGVELDPDVLMRADEIVRKYRLGIRTKPNFCAHLKDKALPFKKIKECKTRVFTGAPLDWSLVVRKFLLTFVKLVQDNRFVCEGAVGTIAQSLEWEEMFEYLTQFGQNRMVAGDYRDYDKKMAAAVILAVFDVIIKILQKAGWPPEDIIVIRCIAVDTAYALVDFNGDLIEFFGTNPSGHPLTVILNCFANSLYMRYAYTVGNPSKTCTDFKQYVALMTYGDDNELGVHIERDWFNHTTIQKALLDIGVEYTMADKESETVPFVHIDETSFLKRSWRWDSDVGAYLAPLEHDSIETMLTMCVNSETICPEAHAVDIIESAMNEYFFYGKKVFNEKRLMLINTTIVLDMEHFVKSSTFPTWEYLVHRFWDASTHVVLGKFTSPFSPERPTILRRLPSRRDIIYVAPKEAHHDSYCAKSLENDEARMDCDGNVPECSSKSLFREREGSTLHISKDASGFGDPGAGNKSPTNSNTMVETYSQESTDYKFMNIPEMCSHLQIQSEDEFDEIVHMSDAMLGRLVKATWIEGQHVKFKRMLLREYVRVCEALQYLTPEEKLALSDQVKQEIQRNFIRSIQADDVLENSGPQVEQNMTFVDGSQFPDMIMPTLMGPTYDGDTDDSASLGKFLSRPVLINTYTWAEGGTTLFLNNFTPWSSFFNDANIKKKLDNYSRLHCSLRLKFVINASPFYSGALRVVYSPRTAQVYTTQTNDQIIYSQRPGVWLEPQTMTSVEMTLPFLNPNNWLDVNTASEFSTMGRIDFVQYSALRSANGVSGLGVTISTYAWAEDVTLCGPTTLGALVQSDEYIENGVVSGPATAVADIAARLNDAPVIGQFARATEFGARAVAGIAKLFGFSNPPNISDVAPMQPKAFHAMANVDTCVPHDKLSLDSKNEVVISNDVAGVDNEDTLALSNLITRESFLKGSLWTGAYTPQQLVFAWVVTPCPTFSAVSGANTSLWYTPLSYFAAMFAQWRGSIHYRLKFVKTKYHRGRVIISWDPNADITGTNDTETTCYSRIVDLEFEDEIDFIVPYKAKTPWLGTATYASAIANDTPFTLAYDSTRANGTVTVRVLNVLTGPAASPQIDLLLFSKAGDDFMLSVPQVLPTSVSPAVQSADVIEVASHETPYLDQYVCGVTVGETVASLRPLLHRSSYWSTQEVGSYKSGISSYSGAGVQFCTNILTKFPRSYGNDAQGYNWATISGASARFNFCANHPIDWVLNAFVGVRGSTVMIVNLNSESSNSTIGTSVSIGRFYGTDNLNTTQNVNRFTVTYNNAGDASNLARTNITSTSNVVRRNTGTRGLSLTNQRTQAGVSVVIPQYSNVRFRPAYTSERNNLATDYENVRVDTVFRTANAGGATQPWPVMDIYYAAGVDFNPIFFLSTPRLYSAAVPAAQDAFIIP